MSTVTASKTVEYQVERVRLGRHLPRSAVRQLLTDHAEYGGWELTRLRRYRDGTRDVWIRRKIIRQRRPEYAGSGVGLSS